MKNKNETLVAISKFMSLVLRHQPGLIGLELDEAGWTDVDALLGKAARKGRRITREQLLEVVATSDKKRFALSEDGRRIRANQGHSVAVDLGLTPRVPPDVLLHGTATRSLDAILRSGLEKRTRHHVHLTTNEAGARAVGQRYGQVVLLKIDARRMHEDGHVFYCSENGVWLVDAVPPEYLSQV